MKPIIALLLILSPLFAQRDVVTIKHKFYTVSFDTVKHYPVLVNWWVCRKMLNGSLIRMNIFCPDPAIQRHTNLESSYQGSGYDRGHNMPAADNEFDKTALAECFYYSNMTPQYPSLNRGDWKQLEFYTRALVDKYDSVRVWCGSVGEVKKIGVVSAPKICWKALYVKKLKTYSAYVYQNNGSSGPTESHRVTMDSLYKITKIKIK